MEKITAFWKYVGEFELLENDLQNIAICGFILLVGLLLKRFISVRFSRFVYTFVKRASSDIPAVEFVDLLKRPVELFFSLLLISAAFSFLHYPQAWHLVSSRKFGLKMFIDRSYQLLFFFSVIWVIFGVIDFFALVLKKNAIENESKIQEQLVPFLKQLVKLGIAVFFFFTILGVVFKLNVGAIITGLGIGGVAVALAGKETLENLLASFSIFIDKPFIAGDMVKIGAITGNVETVGFRTTRIRTLDKSMVTIPNKQLIDQPLENLSHRKYHRAKFTVGIPYNTSSEKVKEMVENIKTVINAHPQTNENPVVYFENFGTYTIDITIIYIAQAVEYEEFWQVKEDLNYKILQIIEESGTDIEYPTSIVYLRNQTETGSFYNKKT